VSRRVWIPAAIAATALLVAYFGSTSRHTEQIQHFATGIGAHTDVNLVDGSRLHLNTDTSVAVLIDSRKRNVTLEKGEVLFEVRPDPTRDFNVIVGDRRIRVVGTVFNVLSFNKQITVSVARGVVLVKPEGQKSTPPVNLVAGDQYDAKTGSSEYDLKRTDVSTVAAWRDGRLVFNNTPLEEVASQLNRYFTRQIFVQGDIAPHMLFSGILKVDDAASTARRLSAFLPIAVQETNDKVILKEKK
jgi:transmembrane sensor